MHKAEKSLRHNSMASSEKGFYLIDRKPVKSSTEEAGMIMRKHKPAEMKKIFGSPPGVLKCLNPRTGKKVWATADVDASCVVVSEKFSHVIACGNGAYGVVEDGGQGKLFNSRSG